MWLSEGQRTAQAWVGSGLVSALFCQRQPDRCYCVLAGCVRILREQHTGRHAVAAAQAISVLLLLLLPETLRGSEH